MITTITVWVKVGDFPKLCLYIGTCRESVDIEYCATVFKHYEIPIYHEKMMGDSIQVNLPLPLFVATL